MSDSPFLPLLIETEQLQAVIDQPQLLIIDVCSADNYRQHHIPGAIHIAPASLQSGVKPAAGKLPDQQQLAALFASIGLNAEQHVVVYDDEGGGWAGRLIWTLDVLGYHNYSYLNGGLPAWLAEQRPTETTVRPGKPCDFEVHINRAAIAEVDDILPRLDDDDFAIWDARSAKEYCGEKVLAAKGGHIPGAINLDWLELMDRGNHLRLIDLEQLQNRLDTLGLSRDKEIVTHCQSHHRSGLTYLAMKILGYENIRAYHGSWGEWGNLEHTPVER